MRTLVNVNGPTPLPILGSALDFSSCDTILPTITNYIKKHGKLVKLMLGIEPVLIVADYKAIESVLGSHKLLKKSLFYRFFYKWLKLGLLTSSGTKWKQRRRILTPSYHFQILEQFVPIFDKVSNLLIEEFKKEPQKSAVDVYPYVTLSTLDVICETAMGVPVNAQINKTSAYVQSVKTMGRIIIDRVFKPNQQYEWLYSFTENYKTERECLRILHGHTQSVIKNRRNELLKIKDRKNIDQDNDIGAKKRVAFLDLLLQSTDENGEPLSNEAIQEEVDTFMFEGHDTTSSGISFALYEIANNPDVQKKILDEQADIFADNTSEISYNDLNQMKYLEMVIKETLRMYPSVPFYGRQTTEEFQITEDVKLPSGFTVLVFANDIHRDEEFFPNPHKFNPDRFLPENNMGKHPYSFVPFSAGPRNCIGQKFAILEMKMTLSKIVRHFELKPTVPFHTLGLSAESILKSNNGILIQMCERKTK